MSTAPAALSPLAADGRRTALALLLAGSGALLGGALAFQHLGGLAPCEMCYWQRWAHVGVLGLGLGALAVPRRGLAWLAMLAMLVAGGLGLFHAGVEQGWWQGPTACSAPLAGGLSTQDALKSILAAPLVRCDQVAWSLLGISMAGWNALASLSFGGLAAWMLVRR